MEHLTPKYRKRLAILWAMEALMIAWNLWRASFAAMAVPSAVCWLYVIACTARESARFKKAFSLRYPSAFQEWQAENWNQAVLRNVQECPVPGDADLRRRWADLKSTDVLVHGVFRGYMALFFALLIRMAIFGPYE